jgi:hypothetical protein
MTENLKQEIFDICSDHRPKYLYAEAFVRIKKLEDREEYYISDVDWAFTKLGDLPEEELIESIKNLDLIEIYFEGTYQLRGLFPVEYDSDDYRQCAYLGDPEIIEFILSMTFEEEEEWEKEFKIEIPSLTENLFNLK